MENVVDPGSRLMSVKAFVTVVGNEERTVDEIVFCCPWRQNVATSGFGCSPCGIEVSTVDHSL